MHASHFCVLQVHVAYQTSGCIAVHDHDALRHLDFVHDFAAANSGSLSSVTRDYNEAREFVRLRKPGQVGHYHVSSDVMNQKCCRGRFSLYTAQLQSPAFLKALNSSMGLRIRGN